MAMQGMNTAAGRDNFKAASMQSKIPMGPGHKTASAPSNGDGPTIGMGAVKGFGSGKPHGSTINAVGGPVGKAPQTPGTAVRGFSGSGMLKGKV